MKNVKKVTKPLRVKDLSAEDRAVLDKILKAEQSSKTACGGFHLARQVEHNYDLQRSDELSQRYNRLIREHWIVPGVPGQVGGLVHYEVAAAYTQALQRAR